MKLYFHKNHLSYGKTSQTRRTIQLPQNKPNLKSFKPSDKIIIVAISPNGIIKLTSVKKETTDVIEPEILLYVSNSKLYAGMTSPIKLIKKSMRPANKLVKRTPPNQ